MAIYGLNQGRNSEGKTLEREILKGVKGEGLEEVDEFVGNPVNAFFFFGIGVCLGIWGFAVART